MKKFFLLGGIGLILLGGIFLWQNKKEDSLQIISPLGEKDKGPLEKYAFENLRKKTFLGSQIKLEKVLKEESDYTSYLFSYETEGKRITGMANIPKRETPIGGFPVIVMIRGYGDKEIYSTGVGTQKPAAFFAKNGFLTLAPDFLGFGGSDPQISSDILEDRFQRPLEILALLASIKNLKEANPEKIALWGHSNGGQIALSVLEITQKAYPTILWAPVTLGFPQSVLVYLKEMDDQGLKVKTRIDDFLKDYEASHFSIDNYFADISASLQVHQGTADEYINLEWTNNFVQKMNNLGKKVDYFVYQNDDHNLRLNWNTVILRDLVFLRKNL